MTTRPELIAALQVEGFTHDPEYVGPIALIAPCRTRRAILAERAVMWEERIQFDSGRGYWRHQHTERYTP